jgi:translation elongation factor EF-Tu-like GTPase
MMMIITDIHVVTGRGVVLCGTAGGSPEVKSTVEIRRKEGENTESMCTYVELWRNKLGLVLRGVTEDNISTGDVVVFAARG